MTITLMHHFFALFLRARQLATVGAIADPTPSSTPARRAQTKASTLARIPVAMVNILKIAATSTDAALLERFASHSDGLSAREAQERRAPLTRMQRLAQTWRTWFAPKQPAGLNIGDATLRTALVLRRDISKDAAPVFARYFGAQIQVKESRQMRLPVSMLMPGEVIVLAQGDIVPAHCRLLRTNDLLVNQALPQETPMPVKKQPTLQHFSASHILDLDNILLAGSEVISGSGTALVVCLPPTPSPR